MFLEVEYCMEKESERKREKDRKIRKEIDHDYFMCMCLKRVLMFEKVSRENEKG